MIRLAQPDITFDEVASDFQAIFESGWLTGGDYVRQFEDALANYIGVEHAIATTSATTALHLALKAAGIGAGDEVLVSDFTFPATGNVVVEAGAVPKLVDCAPGRFTLDVADAESKITRRTRAIMPVDPFGQPADMPEIVALARKHDLIVIEDAACAIGARRGGVKCGAFPDAGCFSFHPRKILTTGEGGALTTGDSTLAETARRLRSHGGIAGKVGMMFVDNGFNYRMNELQAAMGIAQMHKLDAMLDARRTKAKLYSELLREVADVTLPLDVKEGVGTYQSYVVLLGPAVDRDQVVHRMFEAGVETTLGTYAMHAHPAFARFGYEPGQLPNSWRAQQQSLSLPMAPSLTRGEIESIVVRLEDAIANSISGSADREAGSA